MSAHHLCPHPHAARPSKYFSASSWTKNRHLWILMVYSSKSVESNIFQKLDLTVEGNFCLSYIRIVLLKEKTITYVKKDQCNNIFWDASVLSLCKPHNLIIILIMMTFLQLIFSNAALKLATWHWRHLLSLPGAACEDIVYLSARA